VLPSQPNTTIIVYDLGITETERQLLDKYCKCTVLTFPFKEFRNYFSEHKYCKAWKPFIIAAHLSQANVVVWVDDTVRMDNSRAVPAMVDRARQRGVQVRARHDAAMMSNPYHTLPEMFKAFGDSPCAHMGFSQVDTSLAVFHNEPLVSHAVMEPWLACAADRACICPEEKHIPCPHNGSNHGVIGQCSRHDSSALGIILAQLFREKYNNFVVDGIPRVRDVK